MPALAPGSRLGPYEILSAVGAGGMGEVYKARDTQLEHTVAVKVLPPASVGERGVYLRRARSKRIADAYQQAYGKELDSETNSQAGRARLRGRIHRACQSREMREVCRAPAVAVGCDTQP